MTPPNKKKDENMEKCKSVFVPWEKFLAIILTFVAIALTISFSFGSTETNMKRDIEDNKKSIVNHEQRINKLEATQELLKEIKIGVDSILSRSR